MSLAGTAASLRCSAGACLRAGPGCVGDEHAPAACSSRRFGARSLGYRLHRSPRVDLIGPLNGAARGYACLAGCCQILPVPGIFHYSVRCGRRAVPVCPVRRGWRAASRAAARNASARSGDLAVAPAACAVSRPVAACRFTPPSEGLTPDARLPAMTDAPDLATARCSHHDRRHRCLSAKSSRR
jgi:hypothetical protein